jgi:hypothetical protein
MLPGHHAPTLQNYGGLDQYPHKPEWTHWGAGNGKVMPLYKKVVGVTTADLVHFYEVFQKTGSIYLLPFMPFNAVSLKLGFEGLCPPGLGLDRYAAIATALMEVILRLLLAHIARLSTIIATVWVDLNNGYDLIWRLLTLAGPGYNSTLHILAPV